MIAQILLNIIVPLFLLIGVGALLDAFLKLDLRTLSKLNFYAFVPAIIMIKIGESPLGGSHLLRIAGFGIAHVAVLLAVYHVLSIPWPGARRRPVYCMGSVFYNCGNFGIPFVMLAFGNGMVAVIAVVMMTQNLLNFTLGVWLLEKQTRKSILGVLAGLFKVPILYAIAIGLALKWSGVALPDQIHQPLTHLADGMVAVALLTLGVQLARSRVAKNLAPLAGVSALRLLVSPLIAWGLTFLFGFEGTVAAVLIVGAGFPMAVNVFILAVEYKQDEELASQLVFVTTLLSAVTLSILLWVLKMAG